MKDPIKEIEEIFDEIENLTRRTRIGYQNPFFKDPTLEGYYGQLIGYAQHINNLLKEFYSREIKKRGGK